MRPSGYDACLEIWRNRIQDPFWPPLELDPGGLLFNLSAALKAVVDVVFCCLSFSRRY